MCGRADLFPTGSCKPGYQSHTSNPKTKPNRSDRSRDLRARLPNLPKPLGLVNLIQPVVLPVNCEPVCGTVTHDSYLCGKKNHQEGWYSSVFRKSAQSNHLNLSYFCAAVLLLKELQRFQLRQWHILEVNGKQALNKPKCKKTSWMIARPNVAMQVASSPPRLQRHRPNSKDADSSYNDMDQKVRRGDKDGCCSRVRITLSGSRWSSVP